MIINISIIATMIAVAAFSYTCGLRAIASTIEDDLSGYAESKVNKAIVKAVLFFFVAFLAIVVSIRLAEAEYVPPQVFLETCSSQDQLRQVACNSYIGGVTDSYLHSGQFCIPAKVKSKEIADFTVDYVLRTREIQQQNPVNMVLLALKAKWPCVNQGPNFVFQFRGF